MKYHFCVESLESNPHSKSATSIKGLVIASTKNAAFNTINMERLAKTILNERKTSPANEYLISAFDAPRICEDIFTKIMKEKSPMRDENN
ncbi:unnamed protein product, partial [Thlaspi arvense]